MAPEYDHAVNMLLRSQQSFLEAQKAEQSRSGETQTLKSLPLSTLNPIGNPKKSALPAQSRLCTPVRSAMILERLESLGCPMGTLGLTKHATSTT